MSDIKPENLLEDIKALREPSLESKIEDLYVSANADSARIKELETKVASLESTLASANAWVNTLQHTVGTLLHCVDGIREKQEQNQKRIEILARSVSFLLEDDPDEEEDERTWDGSDNSVDGVYMEPNYDYLDDVEEEK